MKNSLKALVVVALLAIAGMANAQNSASATATANATIICPISISNYNNTNLEFGTITNSATGGTVVVNPITNTANYTNVSATTGSHAGATPHAADFLVGGQAGFSYSIAPTITGPMSGGSGSAVLSALTWSVGPYNDASQQTITAGGGSIMPCDPDNDGDNYFPDTPGGSEYQCGCVTDHIKVGGTLTLNSAANGTFVGQINVAIAYN